ncbi:MAG: hypothetical protein IJK96_02720 [Bacteroidales bacterium]|nr:hypothetical protein [Bacteroidales bacterium]
MQPEKVRQEFTVKSYESDLNNLIKPFFIQSHVQEIAYEGSNVAGAGYSVLREEGIFWALNRIRLQFERWPVWGERVTLETWPYTQVLPLWHRNFRLLSGDEVLMHGTSVWTLLSLRDRAIIRDLHGFDTSLNLDEASLPTCGKIALPKGLEPVPAGGHTAVWSDIDTNDHVNNCMYTQWCVDALPPDYVRTHSLYDIQVCYYHEIHLGERVEFGLVRDDDTWYVQGTVQDRSCFVARLEFR